MAEIKYLDLAGLTAYDAKIKEWIKSGVVDITDDEIHALFVPQIEFVDLGLSVKWAKSLLGATNGDTAESWYGNYYAWGELEEKAGWDGQGTKVPYDWANYKYANGTYSSSNRKVFIKYIPSNQSNYWGGTGDPDNLITLESVDDVATVNYGGNWRMPTNDELRELMELSSQWVNNYDPSKTEHTTDDGGIQGLNGRVFTGTNGNTLFIPAAGFRNGSDILNAGSTCFLWSSSLYLGRPGNAYSLYFFSDNISMSYNYRCDGCSVCPVLY